MLFAPAALRSVAPLLSRYGSPRGAAPMGPPTSPVPRRALRQIGQACEADPAITVEGIMRIAAIAIIALCMAPAAAEEVWLEPQAPNFISYATKTISL